mgnify:CR=1 FL=1
MYISNLKICISNLEIHISSLEIELSRGFDMFFKGL